MYAPINFFEIIRDYFNHMQEDLKPVPFVNTLIVFPLLLTCIFIKNIEVLYDTIVIVSTIVTVLMMNLQVMLYFVKIEESDYLSHLHSTISMTAFTAFFLLILSLVGSSHILFKLLTSYTCGFLLVNILISLVRIHRLIRHEIRKLSEQF